MVSSVQLTLQQPMSATARLFPSSITSSMPAHLNKGQKEVDSSLDNISKVDKFEAPILPPSAFLSNMESSSTPSANATDDQPLYSVPMKKGHSRQKPVSSAAAASNLMSESFKPQVIDTHARSNFEVNENIDHYSSIHSPLSDVQKQGRISSAELIYEEIGEDLVSKISDSNLKPAEGSIKDSYDYQLEGNQVVSKNADASLSKESTSSQGRLAQGSSSEDILEEFSPGSLRSDVSRGFESTETLLSMGNSTSEGNDFDHNCDSGIQLDKTGDIEQRIDLRDMKFADEEDEAEMKDSGVFLKQVSSASLSSTDLKKLSKIQRN